MTWGTALVGICLSGRSIFVGSVMHHCLVLLQRRCLLATQRASHACCSFVDIDCGVFAPSRVGLNVEHGIRPVAHCDVK